MGASSDEQLIQLIYDGVQDDASLKFALARVAEHVRAVSAGLGIQDMKTFEFRGLGEFGIDRSLTPAYQRLASRNKFWQELAVRREALTDGMVVPKSEFVRTEFYAEWFAPQRFHSMMAAPAFFDNNSSAVIAVFRDAQRREFEANDLASLERFAGHFGCALKFRLSHGRFVEQLEAANFILDELPDAIFLVSRTGRLRHANAAGQKVLSLGLPVRAQQGRLECYEPRWTERLWRMIGDGRGGMRVPRPGHRPWTFQIHSGTRKIGGVETDSIVVRISDSNREPLDAAKLGERLGLSGRQAQAVEALVKYGGEDLASARLGISKATLHTYVRRVYDHLGVHSRSALIALLASQGFDVDALDQTDHRKD